jgi:hypothetical protein
VIVIREAREADIALIIPHLRAHDKKTIERLDLDPVALLRQTFANGSPMMTALDGDRPICMWGMEKKSLLSSWMIWMLTTDAVDQYPIRFLRASRALVRVWADTFGTIEGMVDSDFDISVKWLRWLGFREVRDGEFKLMRYP